MEEEDEEEDDQEEEGDTAPPTLHPPAPSSSSAAAAQEASAKVRCTEALLLNAAIDVSLQQPVAPLKLASSKVHTDTMPLVPQH